MKFARIVAFVAVFASLPAFATVKHPAKKHAKKSAATAKRSTPKAKKTSTDAAIAAARPEAKPEASSPIARADDPAPARDGEDSDEAPHSRRVITHSVAAAESDVAR